MLKVEIKGNSYDIVLEDNSSATAFVAKLKENDLVIELDDYGNFEKVGRLPYSLPTNDTRITTKPGDVILYQGNNITIYYDENTWTFTKLGVIADLNEEQLRTVLGSGSVTVRFYLDK